MTIYHEIVYITPQIAWDYLSHNVHNRPEKVNKTSQYVKDMTEGNWMPNGESIKFNVNGDLDDGAHRLRAIAKSGVTLPMLVVTGLPVGAQETMDQGVKRSLGDVLHLRGEKRAKDLAALLRLAYTWEQYDGLSHAHWGFSVPTALQTLEQHPELREYTKPAYHVADKSGLTRSVAGLAMYIFYQIDDTDADYFFNRLMSAEDHHEGEPIFALREAIARSIRPVRGKKPKQDAEWMIAIVIKAWNAYRTGRPLTTLVWRRGGASPEEMPIPV